MCEQLAQSHYLTVPQLGVAPGIFQSSVQTITVTAPSHICHIINKENGSDSIQKILYNVYNVMYTMHTLIADTADANKYHLI